jgi:3-polyprenyl-4-hydroxybenzoate decarboxylase
VVKIQCLYRRHHAYGVYKQRIEEKMEAEVNKMIARSRSILTIQSCIRRFLSHKHINSLRKYTTPSIVSVSIRQLDDILSTNPLKALYNNNQLHYIISGLVIISSDHKQYDDSNNSNTRIPLYSLKDHGKVTSHFRIESLKQVAHATALNQLDYVIITIIDKLKDEFFGQVIHVYALNICIISVCFNIFNVYLGYHTSI